MQHFADYFPHPANLEIVNESATFAVFPEGRHEISPGWSPRSGREACDRNLCRLRTRSGARKREENRLFSCHFGLINGQKRAKMRQKRP
jgi:hypothetical protein